MKPKFSRISKITVGRLYNLGNYEHIRYELTVDVPEGCNPTVAINGVERILIGLAPIKGVETEAELARAAKQLEEMEKMTVAQFQRQYGDYTGSVNEIIQRHRETLEADTKRRNEALAKAAKARELFNDLGGASQWKDAKEDWDNNDY